MNNSEAISTSLDTNVEPYLAHQTTQPIKNLLNPLPLKTAENTFKTSVIESTKHSSEVDNRSPEIQSQIGTMPSWHKTDSNFAFYSVQASTKLSKRTSMEQVQEKAA